MTKVVCVSFLLGGLILAGCNRKEDSTSAAPSSPGKPAAVSIEAPAPDAPAAESAPVTAPEAPSAPPTDAAAPVKLPPFINTDGKPATTTAEGGGARAKAPAANPTAVLAILNQGLRTYLSKHQQQLPASVDELVTAGIVSAIPEAPAGMAYVIDPARREVVLQK
jgi:hypothetical protein